MRKSDICFLHYGMKANPKHFSEKIKSLRFQFFFTKETLEIRFRVEGSLSGGKPLALEGREEIVLKKGDIWKLQYAPIYRARLSTIDTREDLFTGEIVLLYVMVLSNECVLFSPHRVQAVNGGIKNRKLSDDLCAYSAGILGSYSKEAFETLNLLPVRSEFRERTNLAKIAEIESLQIDLLTQALLEKKLVCDEKLKTRLQAMKQVSFINDLDEDDVLGLIGDKHTFREEQLRYRRWKEASRKASHQRWRSEMESHELL